MKYGGLYIFFFFVVVKQFEKHNINMIGQCRTFVAKY